MIDRDARANGASIRNFGFITVTGQERGTCWRRAMRSRDVWAELAPKAGIRIEQRGLVMVARRPEARAVLEAFLETEMGEGCELLEPEAARERCPMLAQGADRRSLVEPARGAGRVAATRSRRSPATSRRRWASPSFARRPCASVEPPRIETSRGTIEAEAAVVCPGDDLHGALRRSARALRPDPLQAAHAPHRAAAGRLAAAGAGDVGPGARALSRLRGPAGGGGVAWRASRPSRARGWPTAFT